MGSNIYAIQDVPGKGKGLIALEKISKGTRILCEEPIITIPQHEPDSERLQASIGQQVDALTEYQRQVFLSMHNIHTYSNAAERYMGIVRTIALPIGTDGLDGGIFLDACRVNHACDNNSQKNWNENIKRYTVHALRDIEKGEEITIYYLRINESRNARNKALRAKFGFTCSCRLCSLPPAESLESDKRLKKIYQLEGLIDKGGLMGILATPLQTLRYVDQQVRLYNEQGPGDSGLSRAFFDAAQIAIANSDLARGRIFMERAVSGWRISGGSDCTEVLQHGPLVHDPSKLELYGMSRNWKTAVNQVPSGLEPEDFEDWLWKREKPQRPGQPVDLRNRSTFPGFMGLPIEHIADPKFYDMVTVQPRRHWCFLAEIIDFNSLMRLQMEVKDVDGRELPLFFYTDGRGSELAPALVQKGHTVAILYAERHAFMFDKPGIRHEDPAVIKIFPVSLHGLLVLSDQVQQFSTEIDGLKICHGCGKKKKAASLKRCGKCSFFWYCDKNCQITGWTEKSHKANCRLLKDPDMRGLLVLKWDEFNNRIRFPLHAADDLNSVTA
ncbi:hypothetical protein FQN57_006966 [Myotisia sp. PD_48]|nr:hypothetical protein FQN57_006966 [Myotisia sp. PD_48]